MKRLSEVDPEGLESQLIRAAQREVPSAALLRAAAAAGSLGLSSTVAPGTAGTTGGAKALLSAAKALLAGAVVTGAIVGSMEAQKPRATGAEPPRVQVNVPETPRAEAPRLPLPAVPAPSVATAAPAAPEHAGAHSSRPSSRREPARLVPSAPANSVATSRRPRLTDELRAFERAHAAFTAGDLASAEMRLGEYRRDFPGGALALEADVLRIELLHARGDTPALRVRARSFLEAHPAAPAVRRVRKLLEQSEGMSP